MFHLSCKKQTPNTFIMPKIFKDVTTCIIKYMYMNRSTHCHMKCMIEPHASKPLVNYEDNDSHACPGVVGLHVSLLIYIN